MLLDILRKKKFKTRASANQNVNLSQNAEGLRFRTDDAEWHVRWQGIQEIVTIRDAIVLSAGLMVYIVPDWAFPSPADRLAFIREAYGYLSESARSRSEKNVNAALKAEMPTA